jgi:hypothetical protein
MVAGPVLLLKAVNYSGSGAWNNEGNLGSAYSATLEVGTIAKNTAGNGIVLDGSTCWTFPNIGVGNAWTTSIWYKNTGTQIGGEPCILTQLYTGGSINITIGCFSQPGTFAVGFYSAAWPGTTAYPLPLNEWINIQATWDGSVLKLYINSVLTQTVNGLSASQDGGTAYRIGRRWDNPDYMVGEIGEVRIYNTAISSTQVTTDYRSSSGTYLPPIVLSAPIPYIRPRVTHQAIEFWWQAPPDDGGTPITSYILTDQNLSTTTLSSTVVRHRVSGLTDGVPYSYTIAAQNEAGTGQAAAFRTVEPGLRADPPQNPTATVGSANSATVTWDAPVSDGGSVIGWYVIVSSSSNPSDPVLKMSARGVDRSLLVEGLTSGSQYTFTIYTVNDIRYSVAATTNQIIVLP